MDGTRRRWGCSSYLSQMGEKGREMYESPVQLKFNEIKTELIKKENEMLIRAVQEVVPTVTEEELLKALAYDRHQYEKGYWDGKEARDAEIVRCKECKHRYAEDGLCKGRGWPMQLVPDDGFCDKGERREDAEL